MGGCKRNARLPGLLLLVALVVAFHRRTPTFTNFRLTPAAATTARCATDGSYKVPEQEFTDMLRSLPGGGGLADRKTLPLGIRILRQKAALVKPDKIASFDTRDMVCELVRVMRGPRLPGRTLKGGSLALPQIGTPSRFIVYEDPQAELDELPEEERRSMRREAFGLKAVFNPTLSRVGNGSFVHFERSASIPAYRALVKRADKVRVRGIDPEGQEVDYVATNHEARLVQQAVDVLNGKFFTDRCNMRSLRHLDTLNEPLPPGCPLPDGGVAPEVDVKSAEKGGSRGLMVVDSKKVLLIGSLLLRLKAEEVEDVAASDVQEMAKKLEEAIATGEHPLGVAAPQLGRSLRMVAVGESEKALAEMDSRTKTAEEHRKSGPLVIINPKVKRKEKTPTAYFFEKTPSVPGYEAVVGRALEVEVQGVDKEGRPVSLQARGWLARMLQHTVDVLDGVLYVDRMEKTSFRRDGVEDQLPAEVRLGLKQEAGRAAKRSSRQRQKNPKSAAPKRRGFSR